MRKTLSAVLLNLMFQCRVSNFIALINLYSCPGLGCTQAEEATLAHLPVPLPPTSPSLSVADLMLSGDWVTKDLNYTVCALARLLPINLRVMGWTDDALHSTWFELSAASWNKPLSQPILHIRFFFQPSLPSTLTLWKSDFVMGIAL